MSSDWIKVGPTSNDYSSYKKRKHGERHREDSLVMTFAEIGVIQPYAKEYLDPLESERNKKGFLP